MRLRHKKPLNPYKGQTNNDKSEFNDDDFNQQGSPVKRNVIGANDQVFKYARILTKFIKTVNQSYKLYAAHDDQQLILTSNNHREDLPFNDSENHRENTPFKGEQINQRKQKLKLQYKKQVKQVKRQQKLQTRKKDIAQGQLTNQENKPKPAQHTTNPSSIEPTKNHSFAKSNIVNTEKNGNIIKNQPSNSTPTSGNIFTAQNGGMSLPPNIKTDPNLGINPNNMQNNIQAYLNYASLFGQNPMMPGMFGGLQGMPMQMGQIPMGMMPGYMPNMQLGLNMKYMNMGGQFIPQPQQPFKICQNLFSEQAKVYNKSVEKDNKTEGSKDVFPLKRSAFHVAIAYKIYLDKLKRQGQSFQNLEDIDPTRNARRVKSGQGSNKNKDSLKKKK